MDPNIQPFPKFWQSLVPVLPCVSSLTSAVSLRNSNFTGVQKDVLTKLVLHPHENRVHMCFGRIEFAHSLPSTDHLFGQNYAHVFLTLFGSIFYWSLHLLLFSLDIWIRIKANMDNSQEFLKFWSRCLLFSEASTFKVNITALSTPIPAPIKESSQPLIYVWLMHCQQNSYLSSKSEIYVQLPTL